MDGVGIGHRGIEGEAPGWAALTAPPDQAVAMDVTGHWP